MFNIDELKTLHHILSKFIQIPGDLVDFVSYAKNKIVTEVQKIDNAKASTPVVPTVEIKEKNAEQNS